jgi:hypothetical protein
MFRKMTIIAAAVLMLAAGAQAKPGKEVSYRQLVDQYIHATFFDPYSVQDLSIGPPVPALSWWKPGIFANRKDWEDAYIIRFRCNAKNRLGGYVGLRVLAIVVHNGAIDPNLTETVNTWLAANQGS